MKKMNKVVVAALLLVLLALIGGISFKMFFPAAEVKLKAETEISKLMNRNVKIESSEVSLLPFGVSIQKLSISNPNKGSFKTKDLLQVEDVQLNVDILKLFTGAIQFNSVTISGLKFNFEKLKNGRTNLDDLGPKSSGSAKKKKNEKLTLPFDVELKTFRLKNASVNVFDQVQKVEIQANNINQETSLYANKDLSKILLSGNLGISQLKLKEGKKIKSGDIQLKVAHNLELNLRDDILNINSLSASLNQLSVNLKGEVRQLTQERPKVDLQVKSSKISLSDLVKEIPRGLHSEIEKVSAGGSFDFDFKIKGKIVNDKLPTIDGKINLNEIAFSHSKVPAKLSQVSGAISINDDAVKVKNLDFNFAGNKGQIQVDVVNLLGKPKINTLNVNTDLDLGKFFDLSSKILDMPEGYDLSGDLKVKLNASGVVDINNPEKINLKGVVGLKNIQIKTPSLKKDLKISGRVDLNPKLIEPKVDVKIAGSDVSVDMKIKDPLAVVFSKAKHNRKTSIDLKVNSKNLDLDKFLNPQEGEDESAPSDENPEIPDVNLDGVINLKSTVYKSMKLQNFQMTLKMRNKVLKTQMTANLYGGTINQESQSDFNSKKNAKIVSKIKLNQVEVNGLISDVNNNFKGDSQFEKGLRSLDNSVFGKVNLSMNLSTHGAPATFFENATAEIGSVIKNGKLKNGPFISSYNTGVNTLSKLGLKNKSKKDSELSFSNLVSKMKFARGNLFVEKLDIQGTPTGDLFSSGKVGIDGALDLEFENLLTPSMSSQLLSKPGAQFLVPQKNNKALIYMSLEGSVKNPKYTVDFKKMAKNAGGTDAVKNEVGKYSNKAKDKANAELNKQKKAINKKLQNEKNQLKKNAGNALKKFL